MPGCPAFVIGCAKQFKEGVRRPGILVWTAGCAVSKDRNMPRSGGSVGCGEHNELCLGHMFLSHRLKIVLKSTLRHMEVG